MPEAARFGRTVATYDATNAVELAALMDKALADRDAWKRGGFASESAREAFTAATIRSLIVKSTEGQGVSRG